jgi:hypothetical protein
MLIFSHIAVAFIGLVLAGWSAIRPTRRRLRASMALAGLTFYSGALLVVRDHASLTSACLGGVTYLAAIVIAVGFGYWRLAKSL